MSSNSLFDVIRSAVTSPRVLIFFVVSTGVYLFSWTDAYRSYEQLATDLKFQFRTTSEQDTPILHIDIDNESIDKIGRWPWKRDKHAIITRILSELGARNIVFDIDFSQPQSPEVETRFTRNFDKIIEQQITPLHEKYGKVRSHLNVLKDRFGDVKNEKTKTEVKKEFQETLNSFQKSLPALKKSLIRQKKDAVIDYDQMFSRAIKSSNSVFLPFDILISEEDRSFTEREKQIYDRLETVLRNNPDASLKEILLFLGKPDLDRDSAEYQNYKRIYDRIKARKIYRRKFSYKIDAPSRPIWDIKPPIEELASRATGSGTFSTKTNKLDGKLRHQTLFYHHNDRVYLHMGLAIALQTLGVDPEEITHRKNKIVIPANGGNNDQPIKIPLVDSNKVILNWDNQQEWTQYQGPHMSFLDLYDLYSKRLKMLKHLENGFPENSYNRLNVGSRIAKLRKLIEKQKHPEKRKNIVNHILDQYRDYLQKLNQYLEGDRNLTDSQKQSVKDGITQIKRTLQKIRKIRRETRKTRNMIKNQVQNQICLIGATFSTSTDWKSTPVHSQIPGVGLSSTIADMVLNNDFLRKAPGLINLFFIALAALVGVQLSRPGSVKRGFFFVVLAGLWHVLWSFYLMDMHNYLLDTTGFELALFLSFGGMTGYNLLFVERKRQKTRGMFETYMDPEVVDELMENPDSVKMGGERKKLSMFFLDISGFTSISETLPPEEVTDIISDFLSGMTDVIFDHKGTLDKYEGDAVMAYFGAPVQDKDHARNACRAALGCLDKLDELNNIYEKDGYEPLDVRIGINTGEVVLGNLGSRQHADFTVMGDHVNIAARLEAANKRFGTRIMISEYTYRAVKNEIRTRKLASIILQGKRVPVKVFEVLGSIEEVSSEQDEYIETYHQGLELIEQRNWDEAEEALRTCLEDQPEDPVVELWLSRIEQYRSSPPEDGKELVITQKEK